MDRTMQPFLKHSLAGRLRSCQTRKWSSLTQDTSFHCISRSTWQRALRSSSVTIIWRAQPIPEFRSVRFVVRSSYFIHFCRDAIKEGIAVGSLDIDVEVGAARQKRELRLTTQAFQRRLQAVRGSIQIESVIGTDEEMYLALKIGADSCPVGVQPLDDVVVAAPVCGDGGINVAG